MGKKAERHKQIAEEDNDLYRDKPKQPNKSLNVNLPLPPSINHMYRPTRGGGKRLTPKSEKYVRDSRALINLAIEEQRWIKPSRFTWLYIDLVFFMPDRRIRDSHNMLKLLLDVMQGIVYENDYVVMPRIQSVEYDAEYPRVECNIVKQTENHRSKGLKTSRGML